MKQEFIALILILVNMNKQSNKVWSNHKTFFIKPGAPDFLELLLSANVCMRACVCLCVCPPWGY